MKLLIIAPYFFPRTGGMENYVYNIGKILIEKYGFDITVICSNWDRENSKKELIDGFKVYRLSYLFKLSSTPINPLWYKKIAEIIDIEKPDIINGHVPVPYIADIGARIAFKRNIPFLLTYHNDLTGYNPLIKILSKCYYYSMGFKTLNNSNYVIATSDYYAKTSPYLKKHYNKVKVVPPGVDIQKFNIITSNYVKNKYDLTDEKIILFVGQLNKESQHKGLEYLIKSVSMIQESVDFRLIIVGKGNFVEYYKTLSSDLNISSKVIFAGFVNDQNLAKYYNEADLVVLPSYNRAEGFGMVLIEAQACGTPVIGTKIGGIPHAIKNGETGLLVLPKDSQKLAEAILKILEDKDLALSMGQKGHQRVMDKFTWENSSLIMDDIIRSIL